MVTIIDRLMLNPVQITVNGEQTTVTALEAIMLQLLQKGMEGNRVHFASAIYTLRLPTPHELSQGIYVA